MAILKIYPLMIQLQVEKLAKSMKEVKAIVLALVSAIQAPITMIYSRMLPKMRSLYH